jgi:hypothetical protein
VPGARNRKGALKTVATFRRRIRKGCNGATIKFAGPAGHAWRDLRCDAIDPDAAKLNFAPKSRIVGQTRRANRRGVTCWLVVAARFARTLVPDEIFSCPRSCVSS